jgi:hypothetical protein
VKTLLRLHRYLSCCVAPAMLFFAISGAWQAFRLQETRKDGSYVAPPVLARLSEVHKAERLSGPAGTVFRVGQLAVAAMFATTAIVGLVMAFRVARPVWLVWACLAAGSALPVILAVAARAR